MCWHRRFTVCPLYERWVFFENCIEHNFSVLPVCMIYRLQYTHVQTLWRQQQQQQRQHIRIVYSHIRAKQSESAQNFMAATAATALRTWSVYCIGFERACWVYNAAFILFVIRFVLAAQCNVKIFFLSVYAMFGICIAFSALLLLPMSLVRSFVLKLVHEHVMNTNKIFQLCYCNLACIGMCVWFQLKQLRLIVWFVR